MDSDSENSNNRTWKEIDEILDLAKLSKNDLHSKVDVIYYPTDKTDHNYKLLQLDNELIENFIPGTRVLICGDKEDPAVLCTAKKTFELKESVNFNSILLFKDLSSNSESVESAEPNILKREVIGTYDKLYETRLCQSRTKKIAYYLKPSLYKGKEYEKDLESSNIPFYTFETLRVHIQASDEDIESELTNIHVVKYKGFLRMLDYSYHFEVLTRLLCLVDENSWAYNQVIKVELVETLSDLIPEEIISECFDWYTKPLENGLYELNEFKICRFLGHFLLQHSHSRFILNDFLKGWQNSVPEGMKTNENQLQGIGFCDMKCIPPSMIYFPETELPEDISERLKIIFQVREKWTLEQITPYLSRMTTPTIDVGKLLTIYTRSEMINGARYFGQKHK